MAPASRHRMPVDGRPPSRRLRAALTRGSRWPTVRYNGSPAYLGSGFSHPWTACTDIPGGGNSRRSARDAALVLDRTSAKMAA